MNALAITDHGNLYGALEFYEACHGAGINPIVGYEAYVAPASRFERSGESSRESSLPSHAAREESHGLREPGQAFEQGVFGRLLSQAANRSRAARGPQRRADLPERLRVGRVEPDAARRQHGRRGDRQGPRTSPAWFHGVFGDRYFIEIQNNGLEIQRQALELSVDAREAHGFAAGRHVRRPLRPPRGCGRPGRAALHQHGQVPHRYESHADGRRSILSPQPAGDVRDVCRHGGCGRPQPADRRQRRHPARTREAAFSRVRAAASQDVGRLSPRIVRGRLARAVCERSAALAERRSAIGRSCADEVRQRLERELDVINKLGFAITS